MLEAEGSGICAVCTCTDSCLLLLMWLFSPRSRRLKIQRSQIFASCWHLQSSQVKRWIYYSKVESVGGCRFQVHLCILACVISRKFTREAIMTFLPAQFPWIWCDCLVRNPFKKFFLTGYREGLVKYSLPLHMQESPFEFDTSYGND